MKKHKNGFTLAEVLITLVIIGIIAAITIPSIIQNTNKQEYYAKLKKGYSTFSNALHIAQVQEGTIGDNSSIFPQNENFYKGLYEATLKISKYLNSVKVCKNSSDANCEDVYYMNDKSFQDSNYSAIVLSDGTIYKFLLTNYEPLTVYFVIDVNGQKNPNKLGEDIFAFIIRKDKIEAFDETQYIKIISNSD